jgi:hypothetical protein
MSFSISTNRNEVLHGKTIAEQEQRKQQILNTDIQEAYHLYTIDATIVAAADQYLFEKPMDDIYYRSSANTS